MGKDIDFEYIQRMIDENPDDWWASEIAELRFSGALKLAARGRVELTQEEKDALALKA